MVFWHEPTRRWIMLLYGNSSYYLFTSTNLLEWRKEEKRIPESFEYSVGDFDGAKFKAETDQIPCDQGPNFYATQTWGNIAGQEGRRIQIAWMRDGKYPDMPFNQQMTFPCDLTLRETNGALRIFRRPVPEIERLHLRRHSWKDLALTPGASWPLEVSGDLFHILVEVDVPAGSTLTFRIRGLPVAITDRSAAAGSRPPVRVDTGVKTVQLLVDRTSLETFINGGETSLSACFLPEDDRLAVECSQGPARVSALEVFELGSIWNAPGSGATPHPATSEED